MASKEKILIIGSGGREHAVGWKISQSPRATELYFAPGNAGTLKLGINVNILATEIPKLIQFVKKEHIDLTLALPDDPLALGIVNEFQKEKLRIWGPTKEASKLEWSKVHAKEFMNTYKIPTARARTFTDYENAKFYLDLERMPIVIKVSGLALGKGVTVAQTKEEAEAALKAAMVDKVFGAAGDQVVIEEFLEGTEISSHAFSDGASWKMFPASQDHKRIFDNDMGPNTGGMGTIAPLSFVTPAILEQIEKEIIAPAILGMANEGTPFVGCLYPGIMLTKEGPKVFEFNARLGDPETQTYMRLLETDFLDIVDATLNKKLGDLDIKWKNLSACNVVLASGGYPSGYEKGKKIIGIEEAEQNQNIVVFHAGTKINAGGPEQGRRNELVTNGGRVLGVSATGANLDEALKTAYETIPKISFEGMQYRKDIGNKAL